MLRTRLLSLFLFYRQISSFNIFTAATCGLLVPIEYSGLKGFLTTFMLAFMTVGFAGGVYFFKLRRKHQYYLFYNLGWNRLQLYFFSYLVNLSIHIPIWFYWRTLWNINSRLKVSWRPLASTNYYQAWLSHVTRAISSASWDVTGVGSLHC